MATVWDEGFEGAGYEETWSNGETVGAGSTVDEDADTADMGLPSGWDNQCLKLVTTGNDAYVLQNDLSELTQSWWRIEFGITAESFGDNEGNDLLGVWDSSWVNVIDLLIRQKSGQLRLRMNMKYDGSHAWSDYYDISLNTRYSVEWKFDVTNGIFEWKMDGASQGTRALETGHAADLDKFFVGWQSVEAAATAYVDLITISNSGWVVSTGANPASTTMRLALGLGM